MELYIVVISDENDGHIIEAKVFSSEEKANQYIVEYCDGLWDSENMSHLTGQDKPELLEDLQEVLNEYLSGIYFTIYPTPLDDFSLEFL